MITTELRQRAHDMLNGCVEDDLLDVADRIEAEYDAWRERVIELPWDDEGVTIRPGDRFVDGDGDDMAVRELLLIDVRGGLEWRVVAKNGDVYSKPHRLTRVKPDTFESIEAEARERLDDGLHPNDGWVLDLLYRVKELYEGKGE